nr:MAG TPA: hypothetical protein [Caudoviricetes sp.]
MYLLKVFRKRLTSESNGEPIKIMIYMNEFEYRRLIFWHGRNYLILDGSIRKGVNRK